MASLREEIESRRTFAIISHPDAGKTTLTEKLLLYGGAIQTAGSVKGKQSAKHAVSDWMDIEKQRGISVTSSVLQFNYQGKCINILDTPGHQDFSEDTYRTLMAADSAVMVIDAAKGVEAQTIKLFKVCTLRHIPIFTFINKMDREARDPFELMENIEEILGIKTYPMNWPISCGKDFKGVYDRNAKRVLAFESDGRANGVKMVEEVEAELGDARLDDLIGAANHEKLAEDIELLDGAAEEFDLHAVQHGDDGGEDLDQKLRPRTQGDDVVDHAGDDDDDRPEQNAAHLLCDVHEQEHRHDEAQKDGQTAHAGDGVIVHAPGLARYIHGADFLRQDLDDRRQRKADHERDEDRKHDFDPDSSVKKHEN